jgi:hypothetical protein
LSSPPRRDRHPIAPSIALSLLGDALGQMIWSRGLAVPENIAVQPASHEPVHDGALQVKEISFMVNLYGGG